MPTWQRNNLETSDFDFEPPYLDQYWLHAHRFKSPFLLQVELQ